MSILITHIPNKTKKRWKKYLSGHNMDTGALIGRFLEAYMSPLGSTLDKIMEKRARCDKCGKICGLVRLKDEKTGCDFACSDCCHSSFRYEDAELPNGKG